MPVVKKGYEIEYATLQELAMLDEGFTQRYKNELRRLINRHRLLESGLTVSEANKQYVEAESRITKKYIADLFSLYKQSHNSAALIKRHLKKVKNTSNFS